MNCKPGDLAIVVRSEAGNEGKIVRCLRYMGSLPGFFDQDLWEIDTLMASVDSFTNARLLSAPYAPDSILKPLSDPGEGAQDETLQWLPVPSRDEVPA